MASPRGATAPKNVSSTVTWIGLMIPFQLSWNLENSKFFTFLFWNILLLHSFHMKHSMLSLVISLWSRVYILIKPVVSIGQVGCSRVPAWRPFQWFLYMSRVSQKKFGNPRSRPPTQRKDIRFWSIVKLGSWSIFNLNLKTQKKDQSWRYTPNAPPTTDNFLTSI